MNGGSAWRSQSQMTFDRLGPSQYEPPARGRGSEGDINNDYTAQELWLASQGTNLGGVGSLGLGFPETPFSSGGRGRDTASRGLETPGGPYSSARRQAGAYDTDNGGPGSVSAPLSPHRLYAQLEMGKGPAKVPTGWPTYDPRQNVSGAPMPVGGGAGSASGYRSVSRTTGGLHAPTGPGGSSSISPRANANGSSSTKPLDPPSPLPSFQPFSPPLPNSTLRHINGEPGATTFISPSTLLSPPQDLATLPPLASVDNLANTFGRLGVQPPGEGAENDAKDHGLSNRKPSGGAGVSASGTRDGGRKVSSTSRGGLGSAQLSPRQKPQ